MSTLSTRHLGCDRTDTGIVGIDTALADDAGLDIAVVVTADAFEPITPAWTLLAENAGDTNHFFEPWFLLPALRHLADENVRVITAWTRDAEKRLVGLLPITQTCWRGFKHLPHISNWTHLHCFLGTPLVWSGFENAFLLAVINHLNLSGDAGRFLQLQLVPTNSRFAQAIEDLSRSNQSAGEVKRHSRPMIECTSSYEDYLSSTVSKKRQKNLKRLSRRLSEIGTVTVDRLIDPAKAKSWAEAYTQIETNGWKGGLGTAIAQSPTEMAFFKELVNKASIAGKAQLIGIRLNETLIAILVNFESNGEIICFKTTFDETFEKYSPGMLMELEGIKHVLSMSDMQFMDSCASSGPAGLDSLWAMKRSISLFRIGIGGRLNNAILSTANAADRWARRLPSIRENRRFKKPDAR